MKHVSKDELLRETIRENCALHSQLATAESNIDYIAMMTEVDIGAEEVSESEQVL